MLDESGRWAGEPVWLIYDPGHSYVSALCVCFWYTSLSIGVRQSVTECLRGPGDGEAVSGYGLGLKQSNAGDKVNDSR